MRCAMEKQIKKACCGFGHRQVFSNITEQLDKAVLDAAEKGCEIFYTGAMGDFDDLFSLAVRNAKRRYPNIKLICVKPKEYLIGGIITEFVQMSPTDIKEAIMECKDFFEIEPNSEESGEAFHVFEKAINQRFGMATSALICTEFLSVLSDWNKAVKGNRTDELKEIMNKSESPKIKEFIFKDTGYTDVGFDSFGQFLLTAYLSFSSIICSVKYTFAGLMNDNDSYGPVAADRAYSLIGSMKR